VGEGEEMTSIYTVNHEERIFLPTAIYERYQETIGDWICATPISQFWKVLFNTYTGERIDCNQYYEKASTGN
jgi:hypothetical protein